MKNFFQHLGLLFLASALWIACKKTATTPTSKVVHLAIWSNYINPQLLNEFEQQTGYKVEVANYSSNEELLAKLQAGATGYDVAVPSDYMVAVMTELKLLHPLDKSKIANAKDLNPKLLKKNNDHQNTYSLPIGWGTTGIAVNQKLTKASISGWADLFETPALAGKFTLLDDVRETLGAALKAQAISLNAKSNEELLKGKALLMSAKDRVKGFTSETLAGLVNGEMAVAQAYSCDALQAEKKTAGTVKFVLPKEGFTLWIDNLVIPKGSTNLEGAHALINFLLEPKVAVSRAITFYSAPANLKALEQLPPELKNDHRFILDAATIAKGEMIQDLGEDLEKWDRIWTEVKASR